ncbi:MAG: ATP-binding protein [Acidobacteriota bacterium]|nr:ATP-binding protein [Acidobacteriota bacterium]
MRLDWQGRAVILFASSLLALSVVLVFFAIREADREKLLGEREIEGERQRLAETIAGRANSLIGEAENRVLQAAKKARSDADSAQPAAGLKELMPDIPLVSEVFFINAEDRAVFLKAQPVFLLPGEKPKSKDVSRAFENNDLWKRAEAAEFRLNDYSLAGSLYQELASKTADPALRAFVLNRLGRCYAKSGKTEKALDAYRRQLRIGLPGVASEGIPLEITALYQIGNSCLQTGKRTEAAGAFLDLYQGLLEPKWSLSRSQFESLRKTAEERFNTSVAGMAPSIRAEWSGRLQGLKKIEAERLAETEIRVKVLERIIPRMRLEAQKLDRESGNFQRLAEQDDTGLVLASFTALGANAVLGLLLDPEALGNGLLSSGMDNRGPAASLSAVVVDDSGRAVSGTDFTPSGGPGKDGGSQLIFTAAFTNSFPPWAIKIYRSGAGAAERQFRTRRNIYILSLVAVIAALFFGGFLAIRSTARELELARLKSDFVATVSHEFRTPLTSIRYMAELLERGRVRDDQRKQEYYQTITGESERLSRLVENLLDFSKIETGMKEYRMEATDISALLVEAAGRFRRQAGIKDFDLKTDIAQNLPAVQADRESLERALLNLLDNAVKYSGDNPEILFKARAQENAVIIQVEDHGIGIAKFEQKRVFEKFYRSEKALEGDVKGSGIGLPLVDHIVRAHGGKIVLESEPGKGTRVTIELPAGPPSAKKEDKDG